MKILTLLTMVVISYHVHAQKPVFVRVYDLSGHKMTKGRISNISDTSLELAGKPAPIMIPVRSIGSVRTKHSPGNNVLIGSLVGAVSLGILGAATADPDSWVVGYTAGEGLAAGALLGVPVGAAIGGLTSVFKHSMSFSIDGDPTKWKRFQQLIKGR